MNILKYNLTWIQTHPTQYASPLLEKIALNKNLNLTVLYVSDFSTKTYFDKEFSKSIRWDTDLLSGYKYFFLNKKSKGISFLNPIIWPSYKIFKIIKNSDYVIIQGWQHYILIILGLISKIFSKKIILRQESPVKLKISRSKIIFKKSIIHFLLSSILINLSDYFLYISTLNKRYYLSRGIKSKKLFFSPYTVDNKLFSNQGKKISSELEEKLKFNNDNPVMLFASKLSERKNIMGLLNAYKNSFENNLNLIIIGNGTLSTNVKNFINVNKLSSSVKYLGFINQQSLPYIYEKSDIFILPSFEEKFGLVINEAMYGSCAIISSYEVGASYDIVIHKKNGYVYDSLADKSIEKAIRYCLKNQRYVDMGIKSKQIIENWNYDKTVQSLSEIVLSDNFNK